MRPPADSLRAVLDSVFATPPYDWVERPDGASWVSRAWDGLILWLEALRRDHPLAYQGLLLVLLAVLVAIFVHAAWTMARTLRAAGEREDPSRRPAGRLVRDAAWFAARADELAAAGRHAEALQASFQALVIGWEGRGLLRHDPSKTPREYLREARLTPEDRARLRGLVESLYRYAFGGVPCGEAEYLAWRREAEGRWHAAPA